MTDELTRAFPPGRWTARWIWADTGPSTDARTVVALRRTVDVDAVPVVVPARVACTDRYVLRVNGREVCRGPLRTDPRRRRADVVDLAGFLHAGANIVAFLVCHDPRPTPWSVPVPRVTDLADGGLAAEIRIDDEIVTTDHSWHGRYIDGWTTTAAEGVKGRGTEQLSLDSPPGDWDTSDEHAWSPVRCRAAFARGENGRREPPSYPLGPHGYRGVSYPDVREVALTLRPDGTWTCPSLVSGTVVVDATIPVGGRVTLTAAEFLTPDGAPSPSRHDAGLAVHGNGTRGTVESLDNYGVRGFVATATPGVTVHSLRVRERTHPVAGGAFFACPDERLERIWQVGRRTVTLSTADCYIDCPTREQRAWTGDSVVHQMVDLTTNADWTMARWHPVLAAAPRPDGMLPMAVVCDFEQTDGTIIPDWALHWIRSVWNLYRYTGDEDTVAGLLPVAEGVLRWFLPFRTEHGVLSDVIGWTIIDWSSVYTDGVSAALNGLWGRALRDFADMAEWLGDGRRACWARDTHERLREGFELLWDPELQRYADTATPAGPGPTASQHGQAAAIVGGLAPPERWPRLVELLTDDDHLVYATFSRPDGPAEPNSDVPLIGDYLGTGHPDKPWWDVREQLVRAQPFFRYVVHDALAEAGRAELIAQLCLDWTVLLDRSADTWSETWHGGTSCHGWCSTPTRDLMTRVLGVTPAEPGFAVASIRPALGYLDRASGRVPTPFGMLDVSVTADLLQVRSPVPVRVAGAVYPAGDVVIDRTSPARPDG